MGGAQYSDLPSFGVETPPDRLLLSLWLSPGHDCDIFCVGVGFMYGTLKLSSVIWQKGSKAKQSYHFQRMLSAFAGLVHQNLRQISYVSLLDARNSAKKSLLAVHHPFLYLQPC